MYVFQPAAGTPPLRASKLCIDRAICDITIKHQNGYLHACCIQTYTLVHYDAQSQIQLAMSWD